MARFKVKDLMIQLPEAEGGGVPVLQCKAYGYGYGPSLCGDPSVILTTPHLCHWGITCPTWTCIGWTPCPTWTCIGWTPCGPVTPCGPMTPYGITETPYQTIDPTPVVNPAAGQPADLDALRAQLRQALDQVEEQARVRDEQLAPKTAEEIDQLEQRLTAALEELKARKARLQE